MRKRRAGTLPKSAPNRRHLPGRIPRCSLVGRNHARRFAAIQMGSQSPPDLSPHAQSGPEDDCDQSLRMLGLEPALYRRV